MPEPFYMPDAVVQDMLVRMLMFSELTAWERTNFKTWYDLEHPLSIKQAQVVATTYARICNDESTHP